MGSFERVKKTGAEGKMDIPPSLCFAATVAERLLLFRYLNKGMDPNELGISGRTALHISASLGNEVCVRDVRPFGE